MLSTNSLMVTDDSLFEILDFHHLNCNFLRAILEIGLLKGPLKLSVTISLQKKRKAEKKKKLYQIYRQKLEYSFPTVKNLFYHQLNAENQHTLYFHEKRLNGQWLICPDR